MATDTGKAFTIDDLKDREALLIELQAMRQAMSNATDTIVRQEDEIAALKAKIRGAHA